MLRTAYHRLSSFQDENQTVEEHQNVSSTEQDLPLKDLGASTTYPEASHASAAPLTRGFESTKLGYKFAGWRVGATIAVVTSGLALIINISLGAWGTVKGQSSFLDTAIEGFSGPNTAIVQLFEGDCKRAASLNTWTHLAINVLSTALLSSSNYCMQCLVAPTRSDVDRAHMRRTWLEIGLPSMRNLGSISPWKTGLWWLLGVSSVPVHLLFNSAFFTSIATNDYNVIFAQANFTKGAFFSTANGANSANWQPPGWDVSAVQDNVTSYQRFDNRECIEAYAQDLITDRRTLVVISSNASTRGDGSVLGSANFEYQTPERDNELAIGYDPYPWICNDPSLPEKLHYTPPEHDGYPANCYTYVSRVAAIADEWAPNGWNAEYCLSEQILGKCGFHINLVIIWIVVVCNVGKVIGMSIVAFSPTFSQPLMTVGDAISSFMDRPDEGTRGLCLITKRDFATVAGERRWPKPVQRIWEPQRKRLYSAASRSRWRISIVLFSVVTFVIFGLLIFAVSSMSSLNYSVSGTAIWNLGFGQINSETMITGWALENIASQDGAIIANVLVANSPQAILSFLYFVLNSLCTSMFLAYEWSRFGVERRTLRTSEPKGEQRKTYFLQLPFRFAIPLICMSGLLHYLVSQSIFLAVVSQWDEVGQLKNAVAVATCGYSPLAMIFVMLCGAAIVTGLAILSWRRLDMGIPIVSSCSAAIAAACHKPPGDYENASEKAVKWGVVAEAGVHGEFGHCCFTSLPVSKPEYGIAYAGWNREVAST